MTSRWRLPCPRESYHGVGVRDEIFEGVQEALVLHQLSVNVMQLCNAHSSGLPHVRVFIFQTLPQGFTQILCDLIHADAAHRTNSQGSDKRIRILTVLKMWSRVLYVWSQILIKSCITQILSYSL